MTRRVRFTPFLAAGCFLAGAAAAHAEPVPFVPRPPLATQPNVVAVATADLDRDGDRDVLTAAGGFGGLFAFENTAGDGSAWTMRTIATLPFGAQFAVPADLDGDGDQDVVSADSATATPQWVENLDGLGTSWAVRSLSTQPYSANHLDAVDLDRDGDIDVVSTAAGPSNRVFWFENATGNGSIWTRHTIATLANAPRSVAPGDLDGDGDPDVVLGGGGAGPVHLWLENTAGDASAWSTRTLASGDAGLSVADLDRDGDLDVVAAGASLGWFENTAGDGSVWTQATIATSVPALRLAAAFDVDADGDLDVLATATTGNNVAWYENVGGAAAAWTLRTVATDLLDAAAFAAADLDGDGDLDVAAAANSGGTVAWYRNETLHPNACFLPHTVATLSNSARSGVPVDVDGDGDLDVVSSLVLGSAVLWHDNTAGDGSAWTTRTVDAGFAFQARVAAGDVDRDGDADVAAIGDQAGTKVLAWFENTAGDGSAWTRRTVSTALGGYSTNVALADVSGDGDLDLLGAGDDGPMLLFENAAGNGSAWTAVTLPAGNQSAFATGDLDRDGDLDVPSTESGLGDGLAWAENVSGTGAAWLAHTISSTLGSTSTMAAVDLDGDGDLDVLHPGANFLVGTTFWYENVGGGSASSWATHVIPDNESARVGVADLDRDADLDLVSAGPPVGDLFFWENTAGTGLAWTRRPLANITGGPLQISFGDLDRDGDVDVVATPSGSVRVEWYENRGGQVALAVANQAPATANNGELVSMLRATVTHLGRAGEGPLELASLGLLFEETVGDPLTSAEANALVESLQVYRDANGSGVFEPATDVQVTSVPTLTLTNGVATVAFTDGDANVQVAVGTPRTYFVVVELSLTASGQVPNQFRVTLLQTGASRSVVEDRTFDLPLRLACPADVSSIVRQVVPVELTGFAIE